MWNYRIVEFDDADEQKYFEIKEVFYNRDGSFMGYSDATVGGSSLSELMVVLEKMKSDAHKPVIKEEEFFKNKKDILKSIESE